MVEHDKYLSGAEYKSRSKKQQTFCDKPFSRTLNCNTNILRISLAQFVTHNVQSYQQHIYNLLLVFDFLMLLLMSYFILKVGKTTCSEKTIIITESE